MSRMISLFIAIFFSSAFGFANSQTVGLPLKTHSEFRTLIEEAQSRCPTLRCADSAVRLKIVDAAQWTALPQSTQQFLNAQASERSTAWDDTILESDYFAKDPGSVDSVFFVYLENQLLGYQLIFAAHAWDTSTCPYDPAHPKLDGCQEGSIVDAAFVSIDLKEIFQDETSYAHFVPETTAR